MIICGRVSVGDFLDLADPVHRVHSFFNFSDSLSERVNGELELTVGVNVTSKGWRE